MVLCPYPGLDAFTEQYRRYFVGRKRDTELLVSNLYASPLTILYGASGVGKSSVLLAGVVPKVKDTGDAIVIVHRTWQSESLVKSLGTRLVDEVEARTGKITRVDGAQPIDRVIEQLGAFWDGAFLIIFDQFEEYFLYPIDSTSPDSFDAAFARAVNRRDLDVHFMISLREDALSGLDRFRHRIPILLANLYRLEFLTRDEIKRAILEPLTTLQSLYPNANVPKQADDTLADLVVSDQVAFEQGGEGGSAGRTPDRFVTPFLQLVMRRLWEEEARNGSPALRTATFEKLGRATGVVRLFIQDTLGALSPQEQQTAASALRYLVTPSGAKVALGVGDLAGYVTASDDELRRLALKLSGHEQRILRAIQHPSGRPELVRFEIYHDALARPLLDWRVAYERDAATQEAMEAAFKENRERQAARRRKIVVRARNLGVGVAVLFLALGGWRLVQQYFDSFAASALASKASENIDRDRGLALMLALEAIGRDSTSDDGDVVLRRALFETGEVGNKTLGAVPDALMLSPDGAWLMARSSGDTTHVVSTSSLTDTLNIWSDSERVTDARFSPDSRFLAVVQDNSILVLWDVPAHKVVGQLLHVCNREPRSVVVTSGAAQLFVTCDDGEVRGWRGYAPASEPVILLEANEGGYELRTSPDGSHILLFASGEQPRIVDVQAMKLTAPIGKNQISPDELLFTSRDRVVGVHWSAPVLELYSLVGSNPSARFQLKCTPTALDVARKSGTLVYGCDDGAMSQMTLDVLTSSDVLMADIFGEHRAPNATTQDAPRERRLTGHAGGVTATEVSDDGRLGFSIGPDGANVWDLTTQRTLRTIRPATGSFAKGIFLRDNARLATVTSDGALQLWSLDAARRTYASTAAGHLGAVLAPGNGLFIASANDREGVRLWATDTTRRSWNTGVALSGRLASIPAFSPDATRLALMWSDGEVTEFDVATAQKSWESTPHDIVTFVEQDRFSKGPIPDQVNNRKSDFLAERADLQYSADGKKLLASAFSSVASRSSTNYRVRVRLYDVGTSSPPIELPIVQRGEHVALSPDARTIAIARSNGEIITFDVTTRDSTLLVRSGGGTPMIAYRNDGSLVVARGKELIVAPPAPPAPPAPAASARGRPRLAPAPRQLSTKLHSISALAVSTPNSLIAVADDSGAVEIWDGRSTEASCSLSRVHSGRINSIAFAPTGVTIATGGADRAVAISSIAAPLGCRFLYRILPNEQQVTGVAFKQTKPPFLVAMHAGGIERLYDRSLWAPRDSLIALARRRIGGRRFTPSERGTYKLPPAR